MNNIPYMNNGCVILKEDAALTSRIASVHYEYYKDLAHLAAIIDQYREDIQCVVSKSQFPGVQCLPFGQSQSPALSDYPDGVDVMLWLTNLQQK
jgi:hypothetical protein